MTCSTPVVFDVFWFQNYATYRKSKTVVARGPVTGLYSPQN